MAKHTPGPWEVDGYEIVSGDQIVAAILAAVPDTEEDRANAALIAAAPELLTVVEAICEFWDESASDPAGEQSTMLSPDALIGGHGSDCVPITIHDVLRAALAKAKGGAE